MSNAAKDTSANDDVLASIRRLVAEESARGQTAPTPSAPEVPQSQPELVPQSDPSQQGRVLQRRRTSEGSAIVDRQSINRAARAKLLLTDDFRVEDLERWVDEVPDLELPPEVEVEVEVEFEDELPVVVAEVPLTEPRIHGRGVYDDEDQARISEDIESFLNAPDPVVDASPETIPEPEVEEAPLAQAPTTPQEMAFEDIPDAAFSASPDRAARRREATERAMAETSRASAARRLPMDYAEVEATAADAPEVAEVVPEAFDVAPPAAPIPLRREPAVIVEDNPALASTTVDQIEAAVQASLAALAETDVMSGGAEPELVLDEEMLREMVSEIVRRELQGSLGERITRNVRKLVRREIYRALETRDLG
ncbi:MAG: hypothetical protein ACI9VX_000718 [Dinoroseobacter sp.]|jgi:hypothetical protein